MQIQPLEWAENEFGRAELGDQRRTARAVDIAAAVARSPGGTVTSVIGGSAAREGAFRFLNNEGVEVEELAASSHRATVERCAGMGYAFVALDQSSVAITDPNATKGMGPVGPNSKERVRGLQVMTALAVSPEGRTLGVCGQQWWCRPDAKANPGKHKHDRRPIEQRESGLWNRTIEQVEKAFHPEDCSPWFQLDRGGDCSHVLARAVQHHSLVTIRAAHDRRIEHNGAILRLGSVLARTKVRSRMKLVRPRGTRTIQLQLRSLPVTIRLNDWDKTQSSASVRLWAVQLRQHRPRCKQDRIEWTLLTTHPVRTVADARLVARGYTYRWRVEDFHRTWKSAGCDVERSQLRSSAAFKRWATILAAVAARIEHLKHVSRNDPESAAREIATQHEIDAAILLSNANHFQHGQQLSAQQFVALVAQVGGYTGKSSGGPPGSITIGRGLDRVLAAAQAFAASQKR